MAKAKKGSKKRAARKSGKRRGHKMSAAQKRAFVARMRKARGITGRPKRKAARGGKRRRAGKRAVTRREEKGLRHRVAKLEKFATAQIAFNKHVATGLDRVFSHTGLSKPRGLRAPSRTRMLGG